MDADDLELLRLAWELLITLAVIVLGRGKAGSERIDTIAERLAAAESRIEASLTHHDLENLHLRIGSVSRDLARLAGALDELRPMLHRMNDYLRESK